MSNYTDIIHHMDSSDLETEIVGHTVTDVDTSANTITLNNGKVLTFLDADDCCAWFSAELEAGNLTDNAVTSVSEAHHDNPEVEEDYTLHILAVDKRIADVHITGDPTSGYYCRSITLGVTEASDA